MTIEAPERIWIWPDTIDEMGSSVNRNEINGHVEYVRADKLEELAAELEQTASQRDKWVEAALLQRRKRGAAEAHAQKLREALEDLLSWFPKEPTKPEWRLCAGEYGADDAIAAARRALAQGADDE